jgi:hypothetical protein
MKAHEPKNCQRFPSGSRMPNERLPLATCRSSGCPRRGTAADCDCAACGAEDTAVSSPQAVTTCLSIRRTHKTTNMLNDRDIDEFMRQVLALVDSLPQELRDDAKERYEAKSMEARMLSLPRLPRPEQPLAPQGVALT